MIVVICVILTILSIAGLFLHVVLSDSAHGGVAHTGSGVERWFQEHGWFRPGTALTADVIPAPAGTMVMSAPPITVMP